MPNVQIGNLAFKYSSDLKISNNTTTPNTKLDVTAGQMRDSTNTIDMPLTSAVTIDFTVNYYTQIY